MEVAQVKAYNLQQGAFYLFQYLNYWSAARFDRLDISDWSDTSLCIWTSERVLQLSGDESPMYHTGSAHADVRKLLSINPITEDQFLVLRNLYGQ